MSARVLFVCLGNICRSPAAEGLLRHIHQSSDSPLKVDVASAGTGGWHVGELPDHRMREAATRRGITLDSRAQQFHRGHFKDYHYILAADQSVKETLIAMAEDPEHEEKIFLISHFAESFQGKDVPDPYYGGDEDFDRVLDLLEEACQGLLDHLHERHKPTD